MWNKGANIDWIEGTAYINEGGDKKLPVVKGVVYISYEEQEAFHRTLSFPEGKKVVW